MRRDFGLHRTYHLNVEVETPVKDELENVVTDIEADTPKPSVFYIDNLVEPLSEDEKNSEVDLSDAEEETPKKKSSKRRKTDRSKLDREAASIMKKNIALDFSDSAL